MKFLKKIDGKVYERRNFLRKNYWATTLCTYLSGVRQVERETLTFPRARIRNGNEITSCEEQERNARARARLENS